MTPIVFLDTSLLSLDNCCLAVLEEVLFKSE